MGEVDMAFQSGVTGMRAAACGQSEVAAQAAPFFVVGSVRSGTTLVERILNQHSRLFIPPETFFFTYLDRLGVLGRDGVAGEELRRAARGYSQERAFPFLEIPLGCEEAVLAEGADSYAGMFVNLMGFLSRRAGKPRWGEKTPNNLRYVPEIRRAFPQARFVLVLRDGRAAVQSRLKHPHWRRNLLACARHWAEDARVTLRLVAGQGPDVLHLVRFEALLEDPEAVIRSLCAFLGEPFEPAMLHPREPEWRARGYYSQPWMAKSTTGIDPARASDWLREYSPGRLRLVEEVAGEALAALGYPLVRPRAPGWRLLYLWEQAADLNRRLLNLAQARPVPRMAARAAGPTP